MYFGVVGLALFAVIGIGLLVLAFRRPWTGLVALVALVAIGALLIPAASEPPVLIPPAIGRIPVTKDGFAAGTSHFGVVIDPAPQWNPRSGMLDYRIRAESDAAAEDVNDEDAVQKHGAEALVLCLTRLAREQSPPDLREIHELLAKLPMQEWRTVAEELMTIARRNPAQVARVRATGQTDWTMHIRIPRNDLRVALADALAGAHGPKEETAPPSTFRSIAAAVVIVAAAYLILKASTRSIHGRQP